MQVIPFLYAPLIAAKSSRFCTKIVVFTIFSRSEPAAANTFFKLINASSACVVTPTNNLTLIRFYGSYFPFRNIDCARPYGKTFDALAKLFRKCVYCWKQWLVVNSSNRPYRRYNFCFGWALRKLHNKNAKQNENSLF